MLYELVELPRRCMDSYPVSTEVLMFSDINMKYDDNPSVYGYQIEGGHALKNADMYKYKSIEWLDNNVVERLMVSDEPVETNRKWWLSRQNVVVLQTKVFMGNDACVIKNVEGILGCGRYGRETSPTRQPFNMYDNFLGRLLAYTNLDVKSPRLFPRLIPDTDIDLVTVVQQCDYDWMKFLRQGFDINECTKYKGGIDRAVETMACRFTDPQVELREFMSQVRIPNVMSGTYQDLVDITKPMFQPDDVGFISSVEYSWTLLELLYRFNRAPATSIGIVYNAAGRHPPKVETKSVYRKDIAMDTKHIERLFMEWVGMLVHSGVTPIDKVKLMKTWSEEVFVEIHFQKRVVRRYYFDMVPVIIGTIALE